MSAMAISMIRPAANRAGTSRAVPLRGIRERFVTVENIRGYGAAVVERLKNALEQNVEMQPDPRHPDAYFVQLANDNFYVAALPTGKFVLLAHWKN